jgi:hypothetical protein
MKKSHIKRGILFASALAGIGTISLLIVAIILFFIHNSGGHAIAMAFAWVWFFCSFPLGILAAGQAFDRPPLFLMLAPLTLFANALMWGLIVAGFSKLKAIVDERIYGEEDSQPGH